MSDKIGLFTGSFDPVTLGHLDIIERASQLFDNLYVGLFYNTAKTGHYCLDTRLAMLEEALKPYDNVRVIRLGEGLAVDFAQELGVTHLVRGVRNAADLEYESSLAFYNRYLAQDVDTVLLLASHRYRYLSSSSVRELLHFGADIRDFVPDSVWKEEEKRSGQKTR